MNEQKDNRKVVIELDNVKRYFQVGSETVKALRGVSFKIYEGEFVTIQGTSGSGKSTLLNQLGCLDTPTSGEYYLDGTPVRKMSKNQRAKLRNRKIGFVFQNYNLLAKTTAVENVELPLMYNNKYTASQRRAAAVKALQERSVTVYAAHLSGKPLNEAKLTPKRAFMIGNEANGLSDELSALSDRKIKIPMHGRVESLNAAIAAAVLMYHESAGGRRDDSCI